MCQIENPVNGKSFVPVDVNFRNRTVLFIFQLVIALCVSNVLYCFSETNNFLTCTNGS